MKDNKVVLDKNYLREELYSLVQTDRDLFHFIQDATLDGMWYWDLENPENEWMNERFWELLGYDPTDKPHKASEWQDIIFPEDLETAMINFERHCADPDFPYDQVVRYKHKNGTTVWVRCRGLVIRDEQGTPIRMLGAHSDMTELMRIQNRYKRHTQSLKKEMKRRHQADLSNEAKSQFLAKMSHELRTPLNAIIGYAEALQMEICGPLRNEQQADYIQSIHTSGTHLLALINDILDISKIEADEEILDEEAMSIDSVMIACIHCIEPMADLKNIKLNVEIAPKIPQLYGDQRRVTQIFTNLLSNAVKFTDEGKDIFFSTQLGDLGNIEMIVEDQGVGIDPNDIALLTRPFQQIGDIHSTPCEGTGLGLSICKSLTELHGGTLTIESEVDHGTSVIVSFPPERSVSPARLKRRR